MADSRRKRKSDIGHTVYSTSDMDDKTMPISDDEGCGGTASTLRVTPEITAICKRERSKKDVKDKLTTVRIECSRNTSDIGKKPTRTTGDDGGCDNTTSTSIITQEMNAKQKRDSHRKDTKDMITTARTNNGCGDICDVSGKLCKTTRNESQKATYYPRRAIGIKSSFKCPKCVKRFRHESTLSRHVMSTHDLKCDVCAKVFTHRSALNRHRHLHGERPFKCSVCEKAFSFSYYLQQHEARHQITKKTPASLAKQIHCLVCNSVHPSRVDLWHHQRSCHGKGSVTAALSLKCNICSKELTSSRGFHMHQLIHEGVRVHVCKTCGASFYDKCHLQRHNRKHSGEGIECESCGKKFATRWHIERHKRQKHPPTQTPPPSNPQGALLTDIAQVVCLPTKVCSLDNTEDDISPTSGVIPTADHSVITKADVPTTDHSMDTRAEITTDHSMVTKAVITTTDQSGCHD